ncbi:hypothetical protein J1N35_018906 [Gossypium stocksii]|uniref:Aminotransferase-like plant mobile domain-containing protein n=1 Tax=Gossypium stocksii TaxID=47602 RepID=A0A9D3VPW6_9ROSI|nr:hypothetical protein J1N35_018906 [Gossypium stocksii]
MIGGYLMLELSRNLVHLRWLLKLVDFRVAGKFSWGSTVLATLYRKMCKATRPHKAKIRGSLSILQSWARFRFLFLRPRVDHPCTFPLITRWNHSMSYVGIPTALEYIRLLLDQWLEAQFRILGKPYLLSKEERRRQIRVQRERRNPLNPRRRADGTGPSTAPA